MQSKDESGNCRQCGPYKYRLYNYTLKPHPQFHYTELDQKNNEFIFFGIENEISFDTSTQQHNALKKMYKEFDPRYVVCKSDASIHGHGFEMVTQPMTLDFFTNLDITKMFSRTQRSNNSCGMHIHVGRNAFKSDLHLYKVTNFIHENTIFIDEIAGRSFNNYNRDFLSECLEGHLEPEEDRSC